MGGSGGGVRAPGWGRVFALALVLLLLPLRAVASWTPAASLPAATGYHTATPLPNGKVLVVGGWDGTTYRNGDRLAWVSTLFEGRVAGGGLRPDGEETLEARYFTRDEALRLKLKQHMPAVLDVAWRKDAGAWFAPPAWRRPIHAKP